MQRYRCTDTDRVIKDAALRHANEAAPGQTHSQATTASSRPRTTFDYAECQPITSLTPARFAAPTPHSSELGIDPPMRSSA